ncbi:hypothetical protein SVIO_001900 [Streptomyces violaceusniger]|uniref:Uncharacterized protein n=1 Tax=Streptomyces violaceusniger TaxID=68280 RepID=A0A4D4KSX9_STRVO|nr:hypothetical protein SVIO_001900 [Streptomyces violaceusniger]
MSWLPVREGAIETTRDGGTVFLGDLRNNALLEVFHGAVELHRAQDAAPAQEVRARAEGKLAVGSVGEVLRDGVDHDGVVRSRRQTGEVRRVPQAQLDPRGESVRRATTWVLKPWSTRASAPARGGDRPALPRQVPGLRAGPGRVHQARNVASGRSSAATRPTRRSDARWLRCCPGAA